MVELIALGGFCGHTFRALLFHIFFCNHAHAGVKDNRLFSRWRHQMETFSSLLPLCEGNPPVTGGFPSQRPVARSFDVYFDLSLNKRLSKQSGHWWFDTPLRPLWRHSTDMNATIRQCHKVDEDFFVIKDVGVIANFCARFHPGIIMIKFGTRNWVVDYRLHDTILVHSYTFQIIEPEWLVHGYVSYAINGSNDSMPPVWISHYLTWTNAGLIVVESSGKPIENQIEILQFSFEKMHLFENVV